LPINTRQLDAYVGTYELSAKRRYRVEQRGNALVGGKENGPLTPLIAVGDNVFADNGATPQVRRPGLVASPRHRHG